MAKKCVECGNEEEVGFFKCMAPFKTIHKKEYCSSCAEKYVLDGIKSIQITTTHTIEDYKIKKYIDIESVEIVIGTGVFSEFSSEIADFFGARSTAFEKKLQIAKRNAFDKLRFLAFQKGGNAIVGIDLDYTEFSGNRIGLIANETIVALDLDLRA